MSDPHKSHVRQMKSSTKGTYWVVLLPTECTDSVIPLLIMVWLLGRKGATVLSKGGNQSGSVS